MRRNLEKFSNRKEIKKLEGEVFEKFVISAFCFITIPAWDRFFKHLFFQIFGDFNTLQSEFSYALIITFLAAVFGVVFVFWFLALRK